MLEVGTVTEAVAVTADARMILADSATIVRTLDRRELESCRHRPATSPSSWSIEPGVSADISELLSNDNASISPSVNGARTTNNSFVFNGVDVTNLLCCNSRINGARGTIDAGGGTLSRNIAPAPETLEEVKLQTSLYDAATGRNGGGNFQVVSKSGTNCFHGTAYHYFQNDELHRQRFLLQSGGHRQPVLRRNEGGFTIGGPIVRNRTFFFGSYQVTRAKTSFVDEASNTVPCPAALTDDRSRCRHRRLRRGDLGSPTRACEPRCDQSDLAVRCSRPDSRMAATWSHRERTDSIAAEAEDAGRRKLCRCCRSYPQHSSRISSRSTSIIRSCRRTTAEWQVLLLESAEPRSAGRRRRADDTRTSKRHLSADAFSQPTFTSSVTEWSTRSGPASSATATTAMPVGLLTNAEFGIQNPFAEQVPDLSQITIDGEDVGG